MVLICKVFAFDLLFAFPLQLLGGELIVNYIDDSVYLTGDCIKVFDGTVEI